jgi:hypothetical protein
MLISDLLTWSAPDLGAPAPDHSVHEGRNHHARASARRTWQARPRGLRRVRVFEEIAARIPTDSLVRLYVAALDAPAERGAIYQSAIACQYFRMLWRYGRVASPIAIRRMQDSLFPTPAALARWNHAQRRWPTSLGPGFPCDASDLPQAPDSLEVPPLKSVWP